jgi:predicted Rossmann fold nucleotide-binding protein DprA/Smf involved in DNA uptake
MPIDRAKEVLVHLRASGLHPLPGTTQGELWPAASASDDDPVLLALKSGACHADEIAERTGLSLATVQQRILTLALSGVLVPGPLGSLKPVTY